MKKGFLSQSFEELAVKKLSTVEVDTNRSNQHEFHGTAPLRNLFGESRNSYPVSFVWLGGEDEGISEPGYVTWYDARENHPTRTEWRLYFKSNQITDRAQEDDLLILARRPNQQVYMIVVQSDSTFENQLSWLFNLEEVDKQFKYQPIENGHDQRIDFASRFILEELGIEVQEPDVMLLDSVIEPYIDIGFPTTKEFSALARKSVENSQPIEQPDLTLISWMEQEEKLFKRLEYNIIQDRLVQGFSGDGKTDVDGFIQFSLSVQNRRKSRTGYALENHLQEIFNQNNIKHSRGKVTENKTKPDFIFPDINDYKDPDFPADKLTMLGVKSTCKERWRQVLEEADRIKKKHLLTLEPGISVNQTNNMQAKKLRLVLPQLLHKTYKARQQKWLMDLGEFMDLVKERQIEY